MKKIFTILFMIIIFTSPVFAKKQSDYHINFKGEKYHLLYSIKSEDFGGYLNEYYKSGETYNNWSEMLAVHHFPNAYSPIDQVKKFREYLGKMNCPSALTFNDKKNVAMIDFLLINNNQVPIILEFNIFKYQKSKKCGSVALQYAKRYAVTTAMQVDEAKRDFEKNRRNIIKKVKNYEIPAVIAEDIDKCKFVLDTEENSEAVAEEDKQNADSISETVKEENSNKTEVLAKDDKKDSEGSIQSTEEEKLSEDKEIKDENIQQKNEKSAENPEEKVIKNDKETAQKVQDVKSVNAKPVLAANKDNREENLKESEKSQESAKIKEYAPVPVEDDADQNVKNKKQKVKKTKKETYTVEHDNSDFYAAPRNYKEVRAEKKRKMQEIKRSKKLEQKRIKAEQKAQSKKAKKERAKKASKNLEAI